MQQAQRRPPRDLRLSVLNTNKVSSFDLERILAAGGVTEQEESIWRLDFREKKMWQVFC